MTETPEHKPYLHRTYRGTINPCPVCESTGERRSSEVMSKTVRKLYYHCRNPQCGAGWISHLVFVGLIDKVKSERSAIRHTGQQLSFSDPPGSTHEMTG
jgi:hypothetical protein